MAFVREIGRDQIDIFGKSVAINQIEKKRDINDIPINNCALRARYGESNRIVSKNISINRIDKISYQLHHYKIYVCQF